MRNYETTVVLTADLEADSLEKKLDNLGQLFGKDAEIKDQGVRDLAYPIKRRTKAHYLFIRHRNAPEKVAEIEAKLRLDEAVLRYMTCRGE